jgi:site-specific DNA recombinase
MTLFNRVDIKAGHIEIRVYRQGLHDLLQTQSIDSLAPPRASRGKPDDILRLKVKAQLQRVGREMKLVVHNADDLTVADPGLLRIVARAHDFQERLVQDPNLTVPAIASQERLTIGYLSRRHCQSKSAQANFSLPYESEAFCRFLTKPPGVAIRHDARREAA